MSRAVVDFDAWVNPAGASVRLAGRAKESRDKSEIRVRFWQTTRNPVRSQIIPDFRTNFYSHSQIPCKSQEILSLAQICQTLPKFTANPETLPINGLHPDKHLRSHATTIRRPAFATMLRTQPRSATLTIHVPRFRAFTGTHTQDHLVSKVKPRLPATSRCATYSRVGTYNSPSDWRYTT